MKAAILDYGVGNIFSLQKALEYAGLPSVLTCDEAVLNDCSAIILPGVGGFPDAAAAIEREGLSGIINTQIAKGKYILGICLGMQLLFESSEEGESCTGFGVFKGRVVRFPSVLKNERLKVPQMGWNSVSVKGDTPLFEAIGNNTQMYFVHSYYAVPENRGITTATVSYGIEVPAAVGRDNVLGLQFHPEKSGVSGIKILKNFKEMLI